MKETPGRHKARRSRLGGVAVFVVVALTGFLLMTNLRVNKTSVVSSDTAQLVQQRVDQVDKLQKQVKSLGGQINTLNKYAGKDAAKTGNSSEDPGSGTMLPAVTGPGISVTLNDSPLWQHMVSDSGTGTTANINDYVIHQQDIESVVNALWRGGAEAMMIQDQRVLYNSAIICKGNILMLQGKQYSPPYTISAIGPGDAMRDALNNSKAIQTYQEYVSAFGLGWKVEDKNDLRFPEAPVLQTLRYATVMKGTGKEAENEEDDGSGGSAGGNSGNASTNNGNGIKK
ncbi:DUF881 domain-containing protein [Bifidobacterium sp. ESL0682]|uniref:DUF881 domain-containing protein n=1 Tax=Bifidobacterium sp. ESL0682 TaxID=2983212 RepID=UPI0023F95D13|nr:DUF881 domain-containing protein [Bifidobacterium sp. ESL0682]WEV41966.1 DUF881 domain-containing protein [Bifidobacterium sp. ESL0682]